MSVAGIVLAAGFSRRLGRPKQSVVLGGETLLERTLRVSGEAGLHPLFAVLNPQVIAPLSMPAPGYTALVNEHADEGIAASIRVGIGALHGFPEVQGAVLLTCDQVALTADHLRALYADPDRITGSGYGGKVGIPAYFPRAHFPELMSLEGDQGARMLLRQAHGIDAPALELDIDTEEDVALARRLLEDGQ